nr:hypothetical protein B0A51_01365 [Rachicladosporium sp. CCFEE 5018]
MDSSDTVSDSMWTALDRIAAVPLWAWATGAVMGLFGIIVLAYTGLYFLAPVPRPARTSEKQYITVDASGRTTAPQPLPCWHDNHLALRQMARQGQIPPSEANQITEAELFMTLVVPAYNEQHRLSGMLEEAVEYLEAEYGHHGTHSKSSSNGSLQASGQQADARRGWEVLIVSDGSTDQTVATALQFAKTHQLATPPTPKGPWNGVGKPTRITPGAIRVITLEENRGKGGAVTHGMRHARGTWVVFADADGASRFTDLGSLVRGCEEAKDNLGRAVAVGSRAHMVGTEAVVKRSLLRNTLMHAFHLLLRLLSPPATAAIRDTQCGFKLFTRPSLPYIIPYMHSEGWIFDVEMLMLAESAGIPMVECPVGWKEVGGSKLNVVWDSLGMAVGLAVLRGGWGMGVWRR